MKIIKVLVAFSFLIIASQAHSSMLGFRRAPLCAVPWGGRIQGGSTVSAFQSSLPSGPCSSEVRSCIWGALTGSYTNQTCTAGCSLPWGGGITSGSSTTAYLSASPTGACTSQTRTCTTGTLSGTYTNQTCTAGCTLPWGGGISSGSSVTAYSATSAPSCSTVSQTRTCTSGTLSGTYTNQSCTSTNCSLPWGGSITTGNSVTAYSASSAPDCSVVSETRTCTNGTLSGTYTNQSCTNTSCTLPWGGTIATGTSVTAYLSSTPSGACTSQTRTCTNGTLSGTYTNQTCNAGCSVPWGGSITHGQSITAYNVGTATCGGACSSETRTCSNGSLGGTFTAQSCTVDSSPCCSSIGASMGGGICVQTGAHALIAEPADAAATYAWGSQGTVRGTTSLTDGAGNTSTLASYGATAHPAAAYCSGSTTGGKSDWYLPADSELSVLAAQKAVLGTINASWYWSSTEANSTDGMARSLTTGSAVGGAQKSFGAYVRCVRREP